MLVCDRCGKRITETNVKTKQNTTLYIAPQNHCKRTVDFCEECLKERQEYLGIAESFFMTTIDNPKDIFKDARYWNKGW